MSQDMYYIGKQSGSTPFTQTVPVSKGGTGTTELPSGEILIGNGAEPVTTIATLPIAKGGTGGATLAEAQTALGITGIATKVTTLENTVGTLNDSLEVVLNGN